MAKDKTTAIVWGVTLLLVVLMIGAAVYIVQNNKMATGDRLPMTDQPYSQIDAAVKPAPAPDITAELPAQEPEKSYEPEPVTEMRDRAASLTRPPEEPQSPQAIQEKSEAEINRLAAQKRADALRQDVELDLSDIAGLMSVNMRLVGFKKNKFMLRYTCYRNNISPPLSWNNAPEGTRSFVVMMDRVDEGEAPVPYWILFNIPAETASLDEKVPAPQSGTMRYGANNFDKPEYAGPCDPQDRHKYRIRVFALDRMLAEPVGVSRANMIRAMEGHILDVGELNALHYMN